MLTEKTTAIIILVFFEKNSDLIILLIGILMKKKNIVSSGTRYKNTYIPRISLYEAQKYLKEAKRIIIDIRYEEPYYNVVINYIITGNRYIIKDKNNKIVDFIKYEEVLSEGTRMQLKF